MTPYRFQQIRNLFEAALRRSPADRDAFVAEACRNDRELQQEVGELLEAHDATVTMRQVPSPESIRSDPASRQGHRLGGYEILRQLGRGAMGSVYLARRADEAFHKDVAIKILRPDAASSDIVSRFHQEREILAQLDHPNIARLLDAGSTEDGLPYFVMEYVEGQSITRYADDRRLTIAGRIALFRQMCDAVDYAHQRRIVHRDLKPGNVMVTAGGQVKLLDFGIARLMERDAGATALTHAGMWLMTPEYASPEQVRGEAAGRASDVYSLGVILYELLTGHRPYHLRSRIFHEIVRVVCEEPPTRPSAVITEALELIAADGKPATLPPETAGRFRQSSLDDLRQQLSGDLDNILLKALQKHPHDRYASALQLRSDIDRHISGEAVWARGDSFLYRAARRISRYRVELIVLAAVSAAVATGSVTLRWSTFAWAAGAAVLIAVWHAATDPELGRRLAKPWIPGVLVAAPIVALGVTTILTSDDWLETIVVNPLFLPASAAVFLGWWPLLRRRAGPLILDLERPKTGLFVALLFVSIMTLTIGLKFFLGGRFTHKDVVWTAFFIPYYVFIHTMSKIAEIRREGFIVGTIIVGTGLIRWSRIASWTWTGNSSWKILVLQLYHRIQFLPPVRIRIRESQKEQVEVILARHLGEWQPGIGRNLADESAAPTHPQGSH